MSRFLAGKYEAMEAYTPGEQPRDKRYIKLNTNESPYPPAPSVAEAVSREAVEGLRLYCDPTAKRLKEKLAGLYQVEPENIFLSNGSDEALNFAFMAFGGAGVVFPDISYGFYGVFAQLHGLPYEQIPLKEDFTLDYRDYCHQNKMIVIANPNAPTGMSIPVEQIRQILKSNPDAVVVIDEAYVDFGGESCLPLIKDYDNLLVVRTFSKSRCLAGGRLGYAFAGRAIIADLEKLQYSTNPYNVNTLTQLLGAATVDEEAYYRQRCREIMDTRRRTKAALEALGFQVLPSQANFLFAKTEKMDGGALYRELKNRGILVRHFTAQRICQYNRITIGRPEEMDMLIQTLKEVLI